MTAPVVSAAPGEANQATAWQRWEQSLTSERDYTNAYRDVTLRVTFDGPQGQSFAGYGFWNGGKTFKVRVAFPAPGEWTWKTSCSETADKGLHERSGRVEVAAYSGTNPIYQHGFLKVSDNHRYLTYADGTPFLWVGDTPWSAFIAATQEEWESYLDNRRANGFTVVQVHCGDGFIGRSEDRAGNKPILGSGGELRPNPDYWRGVEEKVRAANERGLLVYNCAVRQPGGYRGKTFPMNDEAEAALFARHLAARLMGNFVMYSPIADDLWSPAAEACGRALKDAAALQLISAHPRFLLQPAILSHGLDFVDVVGLQTGEGWSSDPYLKEKKHPFSTALAAQNSYEWPLYLYQFTPPKPIINQEGPYDHLITDNRIPLPPRKSGYWCFLSGAPGISYGCFGIWNWGTPLKWMNAYEFKASLTLPSVTHMKYLAEFFSGIRWWTLAPRPELVPYQETDPMKHVATAASPDGDLVVAYLPDNESVRLKLVGFQPGLKGQWFNPLTGQFSPVAESAVVDKTQTFTKPDSWEDAVLLFQRMK